MKPIDISPADLETVRCILREHTPGLEVRAFGSRVSWTARETSDLDVALMTEESLSIARMTNLKSAFTKSYLPFRVDIVDWASTSERFRKVIEREHVVLVERHRITKFDGWRKLRFGDAFQVNPRIHLKRGNVYPFVSMAVVDTNSRDTYAVERREFSSGGSRFANGDTLMARITPCLENGKITRFCSSDLSNFGHGSTEFIVIRGTPNLTDNEFAYYLTRSEQVRSYVIKQMTGTSGRQRVPTDSLIRLIVSIPPLPEQRSIAKILGKLDDKIELNRRMNKTLEEMAQALFKSWFVDFEPVKAKLAVLKKGGTADEAERAAMCAISCKDEINLAKLENDESEVFANLAQTAAQFPSAMQDSELGKIPEGWNVRILGDLCYKPQYGFTASAEIEPIGPKFLRITDINKNNWIDWGSVPHCRIGKQDAYKYQIHTGDILIARMADPGHGIVVEMGEKGVFASYLIRFKLKNENYTRILQYWLRSDNYWRLVLSWGVGTTRMSLNAKMLSNFPLVVPPIPIATSFKRIVDSLRTSVCKNASESQTLASVRDSLLPELVSGELSVNSE